MFRYMKLAFRKDVYYQSFSQNTKVAFNNAFVRRCKKSLIFSLLGIYSTEYEKASSIIASNIRKAICRIDEGLYLED